MAVAIVLISACASTPMDPTAALTEAQEAIASAEQLGARQYAGAELDEAQQQLKKAEGFVSKEQMVDAERFARQSLVAAELALARTESAKATAINREMTHGADALIEEMRRTGDQQ
ncbi:DUF4398 domain-containing protein [Aestuariicella hydrocarbonica]|uniref:DUF4398 domain-containing protein n=1 Tax=Pseudomaricurvus hydrocarbonicus TaxID=1470433 RepID=A0A9E5JP31_9GAMM|nr:DUF4398 domain-containing protein [Aestuariicella hydrocarbonica]